MAYYFRHDHGIYVAMGAMVLLTTHLRRSRLPRVARVIATYTGLFLAFVVPHLASVQYHSGLARYFAVGADFSRAEAAANPMELPRFTLDGGLAKSLPFLFWLCWMIPLVGAILLARGYLSAHGAGRRCRPVARQFELRFWAAAALSAVSVGTAFGAIERAGRT